MAEAVLVLQDPERASRVLSPIRLRILEWLLEPASATSLAAGLGMSRQRLNYHLKELEDAGVIELAEERQRGNFVERVYRLVAQSIVVAPSAMGGLAIDPDVVADRQTTGYLIALGARLIDDVAALERGAPTLAVETEIRFESDATRSSFATELAQEVARLAKKYHHEVGAGGAFRFLAAVNPANEAHHG